MQTVLAQGAAPRGGRTNSSAERWYSLKSMQPVLAKGAAQMGGRNVSVPIIQLLSGTPPQRNPSASTASPAPRARRVIRRGASASQSPQLTSTAVGTKGA